MSTTWKALLVVVVAGFILFLAWTTMSAQRVECEVCVEFAGQRNCATASADTEEEAVLSAQRTACGPLARGMDDAIACSNRPPVTRQCRVP
jgi:hypothetical protein